jgi:hypothetical protein
VRIECGWSDFDGFTGIGRRVVVSGDPGWMVRLDREPERELYFGAEAVRVERSLRALPVVLPALQAPKRGNGRESASEKTSTDRQASNPGPSGASRDLL